MAVHYPSNTGALCGENPDFGFTGKIERLTCEGCLEQLLELGERAAQRLVVIRTTPPPMPPRKPTEPYECDCGATWHHKHGIPCSKWKHENA